MADGLGYSFAPTFTNAAAQGAARVPSDFPQGSVQVLNYKLPSVVGAGGISPLLSDTPNGGFSNAVLQSVLHTVLGPGAAAAFTGATPTAGSVGGPSTDPGAAILARLFGSGGMSGAASRPDDAYDLARMNGLPMPSTAAPAGSAGSGPMPPSGPAPRPGTATISAGELGEGAAPGTPDTIRIPQFDAPAPTVRPGDATDRSVDLSGNTGTFGGSLQNEHNLNAPDFSGLYASRIYQGENS